MLVLTRKIGEEILIGDNIRLTISSIDGGKVRFGISAPRNVEVHREEVHKRIHEFAAPAAPAPAGATL
jgi:carbon storage regulator